jgi:hypothetical protein
MAERELLVKVGQMNVRIPWRNDLWLALEWLWQFLEVLLPVLSTLTVQCYQ